VTSERQRPFGPRGVPVGRVRDAEAGGWAAGYAEGYAQGFRDGAAAQPDRELLTFVEVPWSSVRTEDTVKGDDGAHYHVVRSGAVPRSGVSDDASSAGGWIVTLVCGTYRDVHTVDHDQRVRVLVPVTLADALVVARRTAGRALIATRADPDGGFDGDLPWRTEVGGIP